MKRFAAVAALILAGCAIRRPLSMRSAPCWLDESTGEYSCPAGCQVCPSPNCYTYTPAYPTEGLAEGRWDRLVVKECPK